MDQEALLAQHGVHLDEAPPKNYPPRWEDCEDLEIRDDTGQLIFAGPRYLRCTRVECHSLVTHGMVAQGGCWCGNRRLAVAFRLTAVEKERLKTGFYPLVGWELDAIQPTYTLAQPLGWGRKEWEKTYG